MQFRGIVHFGAPPILDHSWAKAEERGRNMKLESRASVWQLCSIRPSPIIPCMFEKTTYEIFELSNRWVRCPRRLRFQFAVAFFVCLLIRISKNNG